MLEHFMHWIRFNELIREHQVLYIMKQSWSLNSFETEETQ